VQEEADISGLWALFDDIAAISNILRAVDVATRPSL